MFFMLIIALFLGEYAYRLKTLKNRNLYLNVTSKVFIFSSIIFLVDILILIYYMISKGNPSSVIVRFIESTTLLGSRSAPGPYAPSSDLVGSKLTEISLLISSLFATIISYSFGVKYKKGLNK